MMIPPMTFPGCSQIQKMNLLSSFVFSDDSLMYLSGFPRALQPYRCQTLFLYSVVWLWRASSTVFCYHGFCITLSLAVNFFVVGSLFVVQQDFPIESECACSFQSCLFRPVESQFLSMLLRLSTVGFCLN
jgi:hypothetical protein